MADDWTRAELTKALRSAKESVRSGKEWEAIKFCESLLVDLYPEPNRIID